MQRKQIKLKNQTEIDATEKSKDDSSRMFKAIQDLNKMKLKVRLLIKEGNQYTANKKQQAKLIPKHFQKQFNEYRPQLNCLVGTSYYNKSAVRQMYS